MRLTQLSLDEWERTLPDSGAEVFHRPEVLHVIDEYTDSEMRLYGGFKGEEPVGLLPIFVDSNPLGKIVTSPPPSMVVPRLGPIVLTASPKQRKREAVNRRFVERVLDDLRMDSPRSLVRLQCSLWYDDPRPFQWAGHEVEQSFTYVLDLADTTTDAVRAAFSKGLRREITASEVEDVTVAVEDATMATRVHEQVADRYGQQDERFHVNLEYMRDIVAALDDRSRVYVARDPSGGYRSGIVVLYGSDTAYFWLGGARASYDGESVNGKLHWRIITDILDGDTPDVNGYDLVGANTERLCQYKSKFGATLEPYYTVESSGLGMRVAKRGYNLVNK